MSNEHIKPGDLVQLVKPTPCCQDTTDLGNVYTVQEFPKFVLDGDVYGIKCLKCQSVKPITLAEIAACAEDKYFEKWRLKKFDAELDNESLLEIGLEHLRSINRTLEDIRQ